MVDLNQHQMVPDGHMIGMSELCLSLHIRQRISHSQAANSKQPYHYLLTVALPTKLELSCPYGGIMQYTVFTQISSISSIVIFSFSRLSIASSSGGLSSRFKTRLRPWPLKTVATLLHHHSTSDVFEFG